MTKSKGKSSKLFVMKKSSFLFVLLSGSTLCFSQPKVQSFPLSSVRLLDGPFKQAQQTDMQYILALDPDRLLAPYLREAGLETKAKSYGNWENTGLDGHTGGHYLSALANMYAATANKEVNDRLNYMIDVLDACQQQNGNGYVGGIPGSKALWQEIKDAKINAGGFSLNGKWVPLYNIHKTFAGLRDAYLIAGNTKAREMFLKLCDWFAGISATLSDSQFQDMLRSEHGGLNEIFADAAFITGNDKYLELARKLSHRRILDPLIHNQDSLTGLHANTQIPKVIGFERIAQISGDTSWNNAAHFFWNRVVKNRSVSIGGNSVREHFHPASDFSSMINDIQGPETCNTYNMLRLSANLFFSNSQSSYLDYYERALYNHILSSQHPDGGFVYFTPMRPQHYRVYSQPQESFWCCVGSGIENHGKYGELIYAHNENDLFVSLFMASTLNWREKGLTIEQKTSFPYEEKTTIKLKLDKPASFGIHIRYPSWIKEGKMQVLVNGNKVKVGKNASGYVTVERSWKSDDVVSVQLPMHPKTEYLPDGSPWGSFVYGPIVLAAKTDSANLTGLRADDSRMGHVANGKLYPINNAPFIITSQQEPAVQLKPVKGKPMFFSAASLIYPAASQQLVLQPFYTIHDSRYMIYWRITDKQGLQTIKNDLEEAEQKRMALQEITLDEVTPGEQQPEVEHKFRGEKTETGILNDSRWRNAAGWFSYELKNENKAAKKLRVTYYGSELSKDFDIFIDNRLFRTVSLDGSKGEQLVDIDYELTDKWSQGLGETVEVKFAARNNSKTARVFNVRLTR